MLDFMDYVQNAFYEASHWNRNNSYGTLTATSQGKLTQSLLHHPSSILTNIYPSPPRLPHPSRHPPPHLFPLNPPLRLLLHPRLNRPPHRLPLLPLHLSPTPFPPNRNPLTPPPSLHTDILPPTPATPSP